MHGLGFASGLSEAGLPVGHIPTALLFFSLGVEAGHFLFIGGGAVVDRLGASRPHSISALDRTRPAYAIGTIAMFWVIQRTLSFLVS